MGEFFRLRGREMGKESLGCAASGVAKLCSQSKIDLGKFGQAGPHRGEHGTCLGNPGLLGFATCSLPSQQLSSRLPELAPRPTNNDFIKSYRWLFTVTGDAPLDRSMRRRPSEQRGVLRASKAQTVQSAGMQPELPTCGPWSKPNLGRTRPRTVNKPPCGQRLAPVRSSPAAGTFP